MARLALATEIRRAEAGEGRGFRRRPDRRGTTNIGALQDLQGLDGQEVRIAGPAPT
jgi:hypothetical protein